jgi:hypothetical protein
VTETDAVMTFAAWLTTREERLVCSAHDDAAPACAAAVEFCKRFPEPRMVLAPSPVPGTPLLDWYAAAILLAKAGASSADILDKAAAMVAESARRKTERT